MIIKTLIMTFTVTIILTLNSLQGVAMGDRLDYKAVIRGKFNNIRLSDGIDKTEAIVIAQNYMINEADDFCKNFNILKPTVEEDPKFPDDWLVGFPAMAAFRLKTGLKWNAMYVNKKTGEVKYSGEGPS
jgi:hypothetical protein